MSSPSQHSNHQGSIRPVVKRSLTLPVRSSPPRDREGNSNDNSARVAKEWVKGLINDIMGLIDPVAASASSNLEPKTALEVHDSGHGNLHALTETQGNSSETESPSSRITSNQHNHTTVDGVQGESVQLPVDTNANAEHTKSRRRPIPLDLDKPNRADRKPLKRSNTSPVFSTFQHTQSHHATIPHHIINIDNEFSEVDHAEGSTTGESNPEATLPIRPSLKRHGSATSLLRKASIKAPLKRMASLSLKVPSDIRGSLRRKRNMVELSTGIKLLSDEQVETIKGVVQALSNADATKSSLLEILLDPLFSSDIACVADAKGPSDSAIITAGKHLNRQIYLSKSQIEHIIPNLRLSQHSEHIAKFLGIRPVPPDQNFTTDDEVYIVNLPLFFSHILLLSPDSTVPNRRHKIRTIFDLFDLDMDGHLSEDDIRTLILNSLSENRLKICPEDVQLLVSELLFMLDVDKDGVISFNDFCVATRKWNYKRLGLRVCHQKKENMDVDITADDYRSAIKTGLFPTIKNSGRLSVLCGHPKRSLNRDGMMADSDVEDAAEPTVCRGTMGRSSLVAQSSEWLLERSSIILVPSDSTSQSPESSSTPSKPKPAILRPFYYAMNKIRVYFAVEGLKLLYIFLFVASTSAFFSYNYNKFSQPAVTNVFGHTAAIAKGCANVVNLTLIIQFTVVCRTLLTKIRNISFLQPFIPINKNVVAHRYAGMLFVVAGMIHSFAHLFGTFPIISTTPLSKLRPLLNLPPSLKKQPSYSYLAFASIPGVTGWLLFVIMLLILFTSIAAVRRHNFELFWYTHHLFIPFVVLLLLHGSSAWIDEPHTWMFLLGPFGLYVMERILRVYRGWQKVEIVNASVHAGTISLALEKPRWVKKYVPGQYVYLKVPEISRLEWHPFSLTSASEEPYLTLRIKKCGDWTGELYDKIHQALTSQNQLCANSNSSDTIAVPENISPEKIELAEMDSHPSESSSATANNVDDDPPTYYRTKYPSFISLESFDSDSTSTHSAITTNPFPKVQIDGIFGAPSQHFFQYDHIIFISTGIGATPFMSILRTIEHEINLKQSNEFSFLSGMGLGGKKKEKELELKRVDFYWVNRDNAAFQWFSDTLKRLYTDKDASKWLRVHTFITSAKEKYDLRYWLMWQGLQLVKRKYNRCLLTNMDHDVSWGRPHWPTIFEQMSSKYSNKKIGVFFCGSKALGKELYDLCCEMNRRGKEGAWFDFVKEYF
ncbi:ferric reductase NAD binding domain-containing protein [Paraphysoderma sedebokerense]|nr:ferric reductase NAD binding domain-containing protein [Paraphysoderma sedebokerense]